MIEVVLFACLLTGGGQQDSSLAAADSAAESVSASFSFHWGDVDADGLEDALAIDLDGRPALLLNRGQGRFEDISLAAGLAGLEGVTLAVFADFDSDDALDLFVGRLGGGPRLYRNLGHVLFEPSESGLEHDGLDLGARVLDFDRDGRADLQVQRDTGDSVFRNVGAGRFERAQLPLESLAIAPGPVGAALSDANPALSMALARARRLYERAARASSAVGGSSGASSALAAGPVMSATNIGSRALAGLPSMICAGTIVD